MTKNIILYNRVLCYLREQATPSLQHQIDQAILTFFRTPSDQTW